MTKEQDLKKLKKELEDCKKEKENFLNNWKREKANFENYKREENERFKKIIDYNSRSIVLKILPIIDSFDLAAEKIPKNEIEKNEFIKGLLNIKSSLKVFLKNEGVEEIDCLGKKFDPHLHEAVEMVDADESGLIISEVQKGYKMNDELIRPAKVKVSK